MLCCVVRRAPACLRGGPGCEPPPWRVHLVLSWGPHLVAFGCSSRPLLPPPNLAQPAFNRALTAAAARRAWHHAGKLWRCLRRRLGRALAASGGCRLPLGWLHGQPSMIPPWERPSVVDPSSAAVWWRRLRCSGRLVPAARRLMPAVCTAPRACPGPLPAGRHPCAGPADRAGVLRPRLPQGEVLGGRQASCGRAWPAPSRACYAARHFKPGLASHLYFDMQRGAQPCSPPHTAAQIT